MIDDAKKIFCCYCGRWIVYPRKVTNEHLIPISKGGNNLPINKKKCCNLCNTWRADKSLGYFKKEIEEIISSKKSKIGYNTQDFFAMVENIEHVLIYIDKHKEDMKRVFNKKEKKISYNIITLDRGNLKQN